MSVKKNVEQHVVYISHPTYLNGRNETPFQTQLGVKLNIASSSVKKTRSQGLETGSVKGGF